jgi:hypothetical protein
MKKILKNSLFKNRIFEKKWLLFLLTFLQIYQDGFSQNLVPNPSFENHNLCPTAENQLYYSIGWSSPSINNGTYLNRCSNYCNVPHQNNNYQESHSGDAFIGIFFFNTYNSYREYAQVKLNTVLNTDNYYYVEFWVNRANTSNYNGKYAVNNISLSFRNNFTDTNLTTNDYVLNYNMDIYKFENPVIADTVNWVKVNGIYRALGGEKYIVIGNFKEDNETEIINQTNDSINLSGASFYFIDDVSVEEITVPFWRYHDTLVNYGDSVLIGPALTGLDIDWYTDNMEFISNGPGIYVSPATSRNYIAKETFNGVETEHSVYVTVIGGVGLVENTLQNIEVYPNPSKGDFSISGIKSESPLQLEVRDVHGKLVFENQNLSKEVNSFSLNVEDGIYFVNVTDLETNQTLVKKLVVQK